jgi:hypothetical protein
LNTWPFQPGVGGIRALQKGVVGVSHPPVVKAAMPAAGAAGLGLVFAWLAPASPSAASASAVSVTGPSTALRSIPPVMMFLPRDLALLAMNPHMRA